MGPALIHQLQAAQRALLAPVAPENCVSTDAWAVSVVEAVRAVPGCDCALFVLPIGPPGGRTVRVYSSCPDPSAPAAINTACGGAQGGEAGGAVWTGRHRRSGPEAASAHWIAAPLADGREAALGAYGGQNEDLDPADDPLAALALLAPAFEAGVRARLWATADAAARRAGFSAATDAFDRAVLVVDEDGNDVHRNALLVRLLEAEREDRRLLSLIRQWARHVAGPSTGTAPPEATVRGARGCYRLRGVRLDAGPAGVGGIVTVEPVGLPLPEAAELRGRFGLTKREAEVALLLARGLSDRRVADELNVAYSTARRHTEQVLRKLEAGSRAAVALRLCESI